MNDVEDSADIASESDRHSRRDRWKDALSKTKSRWKKEKGSQSQTDFKLSEDVNDFLAAGRRAAGTATVTPSTPPPVDFSNHRQTSPRPSASESPRSGGQPSPRGVPVPRLDISQTRWPNSRTVPDDPRSRSDDHLTPNYSASRTHYERSHSFNSALAKKRPKPRGLSVTFTDHPPTVIGEGGDKAEAPPCEISRARHQRSRSLSPYLDRPASLVSNNSSNNSRSPVRRKPVPSPGHSPNHSPQPSLTGTPTHTPTTAVVNPYREANIFQPRPVRRVQTGFNGQEVQTPFVNKTSQDVQDFEKHLQQAPRLTETSKDVQDFEKHLQQALNLGGMDNQRIPDTSPFKDPRPQQARMPPPQPPRPMDQSRVHNNMHPAMVSNQSALTNNQVPGSQQKHISPTSPPSRPDIQQRVSPTAPLHHPNLQQSTETSHKPMPPRVPNFYADVNRQNSGPRPEIEKRPFTQHVQELNMKSSARSAPDYYSQARRSPGNAFEEPARRPPATQPPPPPPPSGGWI